MEAKDQIICVPWHADGNVNHESCEYGFITSLHVDGKDAYCRYWSKHEQGELRTKANSELTSLAMLLPCKSVEPERVDHVIEKYDILIGE